VGSLQRRDVIDTCAAKALTQVKLVSARSDSLLAEGVLAKTLRRKT
jgi:hypothetical protein